jgi:hypothetical protein
MTMIKAKPIIDEKFWIVESEGVRIGTLRKNEFAQFIFSRYKGIP